MLPLALLVLCAASPRLAATSFQVTGAEPALAKPWTERFAEVARRGGRVEITTASDIEQLLSLERQKELIGCGSVSSECLIELANALGTEGVVVGTVAKSESGFLATVRLLRNGTGKVWWSASERVSSEAALLDWLDRQATAMVDFLVPPPPVNTGPWVLGAGGIAALGAGVTLVMLSNTVSLTNVRTAQTDAQLAEALNAGRTQGTVGFIVGGVGVAALVGAVVWRAVSPTPAPAVSLVPLQGGAFVSVGGAW